MRRFTGCAIVGAPLVLLAR